MYIFVLKGKLRRSYCGELSRSIKKDLQWSAYIFEHPHDKNDSTFDKYHENRRNIEILQQLFHVGTFIYTCGVKSFWFYDIYMQLVAGFTPTDAMKCAFLLQPRGCQSSI